jgi:serine/threonine protein kinase
VNGLKYLHENNIVHGDIKEENILISNLLIPKICDFGFSSINSNTILFYGTEKYSSPELLSNIKNELKKYQCGYKADSWALGLVLYNLNNNVPENERLINEFIESYRMGRYSEDDTHFPGNWDTNILHNIKTLLTINAKNRITVCDFAKIIFKIVNKLLCQKSIS